MKECSILVGMMQGLASLSDGDGVFGGFPRDVILATLAAAPKYILDEVKIRNAMAEFRGLTYREMAELAIDSMASRDLLAHPPHPLWVLHHVADASDESLRGDRLHFISIITQYPGPELSILTYGGYEEKSGRVGIRYPLWLGLTPDGIQVLNRDQALVDDIDFEIQVPPICLGITMTLLALTDPATKLRPFKGNPVVIDKFVLDPATIKMVQHDAPTDPTRH